jgi:hypothetical protein
MVLLIGAVKVQCGKNYWGSLVLNLGVYVNMILKWMGILDLKIEICLTLIGRDLLTSLASQQA